MTVEVIIPPMSAPTTPPKIVPTKGKHEPIVTPSVAPPTYPPTPAAVLAVLINDLFQNVAPSIFPL